MSRSAFHAKNGKEGLFETFVLAGFEPSGIGGSCTASRTVVFVLTSLVGNTFTTICTTSLAFCFLQNACKVHERTHSDVLPFRCSHCSKSFREKGSLERHVRTHTGEKPYPCKHCGRTFAEHGTLNRHLRSKGQ